MKEIALGILAALFFSVTFILNRTMELDGGSWLWSSSLRYFFMLPLLVCIVAFRGKRKLPDLVNLMRAQPRQWLLWSFVGFVLFYAPITFAAAYSDGWLVSGTWQFTIIAGVLLAPLFVTIGNGKATRARIPMISIGISLLIVLGIFFIQLPNINSISSTSLIYGILPVLIAAFAYPLGNRKMMELTNQKIDTFQRILGMTIASLPGWICLSIYAFITIGLPSTNQILQSAIVAISSGVIATSLFFIATERVHTNQSKLAAVEATQATGVIFALVGEVILLKIVLPTLIGWIGIGIIIMGICLHCYSTLLLSKSASKFAHKKA